MNDNLKIALDNTLKHYKNKENPWDIYRECKNTIKNYEIHYPLKVNEYNEAITYITDKLEI